jgi:hypothetical protein
MPDLVELRHALMDRERYSGDPAAVQRVVRERMQRTGPDHRGWLLAAAASTVAAVAAGVIAFAGGHSTSPAPVAAASLTPRSAAGSPVARQPNRGPVNGNPPSAATTGPLGCVLPDNGTANQTQTSGTAPLVTVDSNPTGVTVVWWDGSSQPKPCRTRIAHGDAAQAHQLAADIRSATPSTYTADTNCPFYDGTGVQLFFTYSGVPTETVSVTLNGCRTAMAPLRAPREVSASLLHALAPLRPHVR